jgi:hypothetical protein
MQAPRLSEARVNVAVMLDEIERTMRETDVQDTDTLKDVYGHLLEADAAIRRAQMAALAGRAGA